MKKKIIGLIIGITVIGVLLGTGTWAVFSDTETSEDNQFTAGVIDLEIDGTGTDLVTFDAQDDPLPKIFNYLPSPGKDIKPGASGEVTLSLHLKTGSNNADLWMQILDLQNYGGILSEPECACEGGTWDNETDSCSARTSADDNISDDIEVLLWLDMFDDETVDPGDNVLQFTDDVVVNGVYDPGEEDELVLHDGTIADLFSGGTVTVMANAVASTTYYVGWSWEFPADTDPPDTDNCHQGDICTFDIQFGANQIATTGP